MTEIIYEQSRWENKKTGRIAVVLDARNPGDFNVVDIESKLAVSRVMYRYADNEGKFARTTILRRHEFLKAFKRAT